MYRCVRLGAAPHRRSAHDINVPQRAIRNHAERLFSVSRGALMSYNDHSVCAVPLH